MASSPPTCVLPTPTAPFFAERSFLEVKQPWRRLLGSEKVARGGASRMTRSRMTRRRMTRRRRRTTPMTRRTRPRTDPSFFSVCPLLSVQLFSLAFLCRYHRHHEISKMSLHNSQKYFLPFSHNHRHVSSNQILSHEEKSQ